MSRTYTKKSLITKLAEACDAVSGVAKQGHSEDYPRGYLRAADVAKAIRHELFKRGILALVDEKEWSPIGEVTTNGGNQIPIMQLRAEVSFRDGSEILTVHAFATAMDAGDKAIYKAKTGLLKYALRGLGLIPDEKDDPEFNQAEPADSKPAPIGTPADRKKKAADDYRERAFGAACHCGGKTPEQISTFLRARYSVASVTELPPDEFKDAIRWATAAESLTETMATSIQIAKGKKQPVVEVLEQVPADEFDQRAAGD